MALRHGWWTGVGLCMLFLLVILRFSNASTKYDRPNVSDKDMNKRKEACYMDIDQGLWGRACRATWIAKENCALRCVSTACYNAVYRQDPLEEGEVDFKRSREFRTCLKKEMQDQRNTEMYM